MGNERSVVFNWLHNGVNKNGHVELKHNGVLSSNWCEGSWRIKPGDPDVIEMTFGSSVHVCGYDDNGFIVEDKYLRRSGKQNYRPDAPRSRGVIKTHGEDRKRAPAQRNTAPRKRKESDDEDDLENKPTFTHKDFKFQTF